MGVGRHSSQWFRQGWLVAHRDFQPPRGGGRACAISLFRWGLKSKRPPTRRFPRPPRALIEDYRFPSNGRVATMLAPTQSSQSPSIEMLTIDPLDLAAAVERDTFWFSGLRSIFANASAGCRRALPLEHRSIESPFCGMGTRLHGFRICP